jgi:hypothetical protein
MTTPTLSLDCLRHDHDACFLPNYCRCECHQHAPVEGGVA